VYQSCGELWVYVEVVAERPETVSNVVVPIKQLISTRLVDSHVTSGPALHVAIISVASTVPFYQTSDVLH